MFGLCYRLVWFFGVLVVIALALPILSYGQVVARAETAPPFAQLQAELQAAQADLAEAQHRIGELNARIDAMEQQIQAGASRRGPNPTSVAHPIARVSTYPSPADLSDGKLAGVAGDSGYTLEDEQQLAERVEEQHQTKVESGSKYRVKLSGLILMNAYSDRGVLDEPDLAGRAVGGTARGGSVGATLRQSIIGLQVFGPQLAGASTSAAINIDFAGGSPEVPFGQTNGMIRLRTASGRLDWSNTSLIFGQEGLPFSPLTPTSYASLAKPAFSYSGNLWVWTPQITVEHRFHTSEDNFISFSGSLLAPLTEDPPEHANVTLAAPGENSRQPALGSQVSWNSKLFGQPLQVGVGGYTSELHFDFNRKVRSWAMTSFLRLPLGSHLELSGEAYRGLAVGGLGGGIWQSVVYGGDPEFESTAFRPLNAAGGWAQIQVRPYPKWEINCAAGQDNVFAHDLRLGPGVRTDYGTALARNRTISENVIFRPRSNMLLSLEYRRLWTWEAVGMLNRADQINLGAGVAF